MANDNSKTVEINRLKSPLKYEDCKIFHSVFPVGSGRRLRAEAAGGLLPLRP